MARCLIIGCGCRGRSLATALAADGHPVRGTTRNPADLPLIEAAGAEAVVADPDRVATLIGALAQVTVVVILLGSASDSPEQLASLHGTRLDMLLTKLVDTTVHGVVYESRGSVPASILEGGMRRVAAFARDTHARCEFLAADPGQPDGWLVEALAAVRSALEPGRPRPARAGAGGQAVPGAITPQGDKM